MNEKEGNYEIRIEKWKFKNHEMWDVVRKDEEFVNVGPPPLARKKSLNPLKKVISSQSKTSSDNEKRTRVLERKAS